MTNTNHSTLIKVTLVLVLAVMLLFQFTPSADAKKIRFNIGFTTDQTLNLPGPANPGSTPKWVVPVLAGAL